MPEENRVHYAFYHEGFGWVTDPWDDVPDVNSVAEAQSFATPQEAQNFAKNHEDSDQWVLHEIQTRISRY